MNQTIIDRYRRERRKDPWMRAETALAIAKMQDADSDWEQAVGVYDTWTREIDGFELTLKIEVESIAPEIRGKGTQTDYGYYVDSAHWWQDYSPQPFPSEPTPMGLPAAHFRWPNNERDAYEFFYPDSLEEQFEYYRTKGGCSKSVARDRLALWIEDHLKMLRDLENLYVRMTAEREGIELAETGIGTDTEAGEYDYIFADIASDLASEVVAEAKENVAKLCPKEAA